MKARKLISNELITSIDVLNTIGGGVTEPRLSLKQFQGHREIRLKVPGVSEDNLKVEIRNGTLSVFHIVLVQSDGTPMTLPKVVYNNAIPYFVDTTRISATYEDGFLIVTLPFNSQAEGYHRNVSIEK